MSSPQGSSARSSSPDLQPSSHSRKRKRKTFSCNDCRRRKLRCDRVYPACGRCQKAGNGALCIYETMPDIPAKELSPSGVARFPEVHSSRPLELSGAYETHASAPASHRTLQTRIPATGQTQSERVAVLETRVAQIDANTTSLGRQVAYQNTGLLNASLSPAADSAITRREGASEITFRGKGFKTEFFGPSSEKSTVTYTPLILKFFPEFKTFLRDPNLQSPALARLRSDAAKIRKGSKMERKLSPKAPVITLLELLPEKDAITRAMNLYWEVMELTYRILHGPTFWSTYWQFWSNPSERKESFAASILLMMAIVRCMDRQQNTTFRGLSSTGREQAVDWIDNVEHWMDRQSRKHLTIESFQHRVLLYLAKQVNCIKSKQIWERATTLLNFAVATGLHQDPAKLDEVYARDHPGAGPHRQRTSPYEREMRRRLWATIVELELQASVDKGIPSSRIPLIADCGRPSLIADEEFDETSSQLPAPETRENFTAASYLYFSYESLRLRSALADVTNAPAAQLSYEHVLTYDEQITEALDALPQWATIETGDENNSSHLRSKISAALLDVQIRQFQILLHLSFARRVERNPRYNFSRMTCVDAAGRILQRHADIAASGNHSLGFMREDVFRATMAICHNVVLWRAVNSDLAVQGMSQVYAEQAKQGVELLESRILALGEHYGQMWYVAAAYGMLRSAFAPKDLNRHMQSVSERLTGLFDKVLAAQEEPSNDETAAGALTALATPNLNGFDVASSMPMTELAAGLPFQDISLDGVEMSGWGFDELWPFTGTGLSW